MFNKRCRLFMLMCLQLCLCVADRSSAYGALFPDETDYVQAKESGAINWSTLKVRAKGSCDGADLELSGSNISLEELAILKARENVLETLKSIPISAEYHIDDITLLYDNVKKELDKIAKNATLIYAVGNSERKEAEAVVEVDMLGEIFDLMLPKMDELPAGVNKNFQGKGKYTSIILDATNIEFSPVMIMKLFDEDYVSYYEIDQVSRVRAVSNGIVRYFKSIEGAQKSGLAGSAPFIISDIQKSKYTDDVLLAPKKVLDKIRNVAFCSEILRKCKIIVVVK